MALFSARVDAALRAVVHLAQEAADRPCQARDIAHRQGVTPPFLDQVLIPLRRGGIVSSVRGARGGYTLARPAAAITAGDVVRAVAGPDLLGSPNRACGLEAPGAAHAVWQLQRDAEMRVADVLDGVTVADLAERQRASDDALSVMPGM